MLDYKDLGKRLKLVQVNSQKTKSREDELIIVTVMQNGQRASRGYSWYHFRKLSGAAIAGQVLAFSSITQSWFSLCVGVLEPKRPFSAFFPLQPCWNSPA